MKPKVLHHDKFKNHEGEEVNRLVLDVDSHNVQVLQYDDSPKVIVKIDEHMAQVDISQLETHIENKVKR